MIIYGKTKAGSHVTLAGEPVKLRSDGTFTVRMSMPDRRQLLPPRSRSRLGGVPRCQQAGQAAEILVYVVDVDEDLEQAVAKPVRPGPPPVMGGLSDVKAGGHAAEARAGGSAKAATR